MGSILPILLNAVFGGGGGFLSNMLRKSGLGMLGNILSGGAGGILLPIITNLLHITNTAAPAADGSSASSLGIASIITSLLGGGAGSQLGGLLSGLMGGGEKK